MSDDDGDKTEDATPKKRAEAAKKGQVPKSQEFMGVVGLIAGFSSIFIFGDYMGNQVGGFFRYSYILIGNNDLTITPSHHPWRQ